MKSIAVLFLLFSIASGCKPAEKPSSPPTGQVISEGVATDSSSVTATPETADTAISSAGQEVTQASSEPLQPAPVKVCNPNFTKVSTPVKNHHVIYVSGFNQEEFKCWVLLEEYGTTLCNGTPCVVYFVDKAEIKVDPSLPDHMSDATLKSAGIGRYTYNGKFWEIKGAAQWKRTGKGYGYFNTDNQLGG